MIGWEAAAFELEAPIASHAPRGFVPWAALMTWPGTPWPWVKAKITGDPN